MHEPINLIFETAEYESAINVSRVKREPRYFAGWKFPNLHHAEISEDWAKGTTHSHSIYLAKRVIEGVKVSILVT